MTIITDPLFYLLAIPAITALGLGKGGFAGVGMISTPLLALTMPPLQAAAILLPILLCQDAISVWVYRRQWSRWNLKVLLPGALVGKSLPPAEDKDQSKVPKMRLMRFTASMLGALPAKPSASRPSTPMGVRRC